MITRDQDDLHRTLPAYPRSVVLNTEDVRPAGFESAPSVSYHGGPGFSQRRTPSLLDCSWYTKFFLINGTYRPGSAWDL